MRRITKSGKETADEITKEATSVLGYLPSVQYSLRSCVLIVESEITQIWSLR